MDLFDYFSLKNIEGIEQDELRKILNFTSEESYAQQIQKGVLLIRSKPGHNSPYDKKVVRCINEYYSLSTDNKKLKKSGNPEIACYLIRKELGIEKTIEDCKACHRYCMQADLTEDDPCHRIIKFKK